jgi:hypothetical protein
MQSDSTRTAGVLFLIGSAVTAAAWLVQSRWGWTPEALGIAQEIAQIALGVALIRFQRKAAFPALAFVAAIAIYPVFRAAFVLNLTGLTAWITVMSVAVFGGLLRLLPPALLLVGNPNHRRRTAAIVIFVVQQLFELVVKFMSVYAMEQLQRS